MGKRKMKVISCCLWKRFSTVSSIVSVYKYHFIVKLSGGCHVGGDFCGVVGYADDLCLMEPNRSSIEEMFRMCEKFVSENNLHFSKDSDTANQ